MYAEDNNKYCLRECSYKLRAVTFGHTTGIFPFSRTLVAHIFTSSTLGMFSKNTSTRVSHMQINQDVVLCPPNRPLESQFAHTRTNQRPLLHVIKKLTLTFPSTPQHTNNYHD